MDLRPRPFEPLRGRAGYTLVELVVAVLVAGIVAAAVFGTALTSKTSGGDKAGRKLQASLAAKQVTTQLARFVSACCDPAAGTCSNCGGISGPNASCAGAPDGGWSMTNPCAGITDTGPASTHYALSLGQHKLTGVLPSALTAAPYNGTFSYTVTCPAPCSTPHVSVSANWSEP